MEKEKLYLQLDTSKHIHLISNERNYPYFRKSVDDILNIVYDRASNLYEIKEDYNKSQFIKVHPELPDIVENRIGFELCRIYDNGFSTLYIIAQKLVQKAKEDGYEIESIGNVKSSLVAYLLGITNSNPLPAHFKCPNCNYTDFKDYGVITDKECPICGYILNKDGNNIEYNIDKQLDIDLIVSKEHYIMVKENIKKIIEENDDSLFREIYYRLSPIVNTDNNYVPISFFIDTICSLEMIVERENEIRKNTNIVRRYNIGSFILAMEKGRIFNERDEEFEIGTPWSRCDIIYMLEKLQYIYKNEKNQEIMLTKNGEKNYFILKKELDDIRKKYN